jgi:hypothetical protein
VIHGLEAHAIRLVHTQKHKHEGAGDFGEDSSWRRPCKSKKAV